MAVPLPLPFAPQGVGILYTSGMADEDPVHLQFPGFPVHFRPVIRIWRKKSVGILYNRVGGGFLIY